MARERYSIVRHCALPTQVSIGGIVAEETVDYCEPLLSLKVRDGNLKIPLKLLDLSGCLADKAWRIACGSSFRMRPRVEVRKPNA